MKPHYKPLATALAATLQLAALAAVPLAWDVRPGQPAPVTFDRYHGEAIDFSATFRGFGELPFAPGADIRLWYQTNGMGSAWWSAPATIQSNVLSATWSPALDPGADRVSLFFGAPSNAYAAAVLRLRHSPGFAPGTMPDPESFHESDPEFTAWLSAFSESDPVFSSWLDGYTPPDTSLEPSTNYTDRALGAFAETGTVARARSYGTPTRWVDSTGCVWEAPNGWTVYTNGVAAAGWLTYDYSADSGPEGNYVQLRIRPTEEAEDSGYPVTAATFPDGVTPFWNNDYETLYNSDADFYGLTYGDTIRVQRGQTNLVGRVALTNDIPAETDPTVPEWAKEPSPPSYSAADVGAAPASIVPVLTSVSNDAATAKLNSETALRIVLGESVWFAVTNYMRTVEGVIPSLQLWEVRDSATNLVYDSREEITNTVHALTRELREELEARIPSKAWGNYQSDGTDNPQPGEVAIVNQPTVILTGGGTFNKYLEVGNSSVWVLKSSGLCSFGGDTNGNFFAVLDDEGNAHFRVAKTDSYDLPAFISDVLPREDQGHLLIYTSTTNRQGGTVPQPVLSAAIDLAETAWHEEAGGEIDALGISVSWTKDDTIPAWVATITPDVWPAKLFLRAKVTQEGGVAVINTAPTRFDGGVRIGDRVYRLVPYTAGGKTYLTLEDWQ